MSSPRLVKLDRNTGTCVRADLIYAIQAQPVDGDANKWEVTILYRTPAGMEAFYKKTIDNYWERNEYITSLRYHILQALT